MTNDEAGRLARLKRRERIIVGAIIGVVCGGVAIAAFAMSSCERFLPERYKPQVQEVALVGDVLVVESRQSVRRSSTRLTKLRTFDLASGKRLGSIELSDVDEIPLPRTGDRVWVRRKGKLSLVDVKQPAVLVSEAQLVERIPELAAGYTAASLESMTVADGSVSDDNRWFPSAAAIELADGRKAWLDTSLKLSWARPEERPPIRVGYACKFHSVPSCEQQRCYGWISSPNMTTQQLGWTEPRDPNGPQALTHAGPNATQLHQPGFVKRLDRGCATVIEGGVLAYHATSAVDPKKQLSLVDARGVVRWTYPLDMTPLRAQLGSGVVYLLLVSQDRVEEAALTSTKLRLWHVSPTNGRVLAKHTLYE